MNRILIVDDDVSTCELLYRLLSTETYDVCVCCSGAAALQSIKEWQPELVLLDLHLPDMSGLDVLRDLRQFSRPACIMITEFPSCRSAVESMRLGAYDYVEKPFSGDVIVGMVKGALRCNRLYDPVCISEPHSLKRWLTLVTRAIDSPKDLRTLHEWGRYVGISEGGLRNWCRTARLPARKSLLFTRVLRAVVRQNGNCGAENLLDVVDRRTLRKLLSMGGGSGDCLAATIPEFLDRQQLIRNPLALAEIRSALGIDGNVSRESLSQGRSAKMDAEPRRMSSA